MEDKGFEFNLMIYVDLCQRRQKMKKEKIGHDIPLMEHLKKKVGDVVKKY